MNTNFIEELIEISKRCLPFMAIGMVFAGMAYQYGQVHLLDEAGHNVQLMNISSHLLP